MWRCVNCCLKGDVVCVCVCVGGGGGSVVEEEEVCDFNLKF